MTQMVKVGMKELDRHLGEILAAAQQYPVSVHRHGAPWVWLVPHEEWERRTPWIDMIATDHPLYLLREHVDARLRRHESLLGRIAGEGGGDIAPDALLRTVVLRIVHGMDSDAYLCEQLSYNVLCKWFVGLPQEFCGLVDMVRKAGELAGRAEIMDLARDLLRDAPLDGFPAVRRHRPVAAARRQENAAQPVTAH